MSGRLVITPCNPSQRCVDLVLVNTQFGLARHLQVLLVAVVVEQVFGIVALGQSFEELGDGRVSLPAVFLGPHRGVADHHPTMRASK